MLKIAVIDDDETEVEIWRIIQNKYFPNAIDVRVFQDIDKAFNDLSREHYDVVIVDNFIPPHKTAKYVLDKLRDVKFDGRIIVLSNSGIESLRNMLGHNVEAELFSKEDFVAIPQMLSFVTDILGVAERKYS